MTRSEFQLIAYALKRAHARYAVVASLADVLRTRNPRFDRARFFAESGHPDEEKARRHNRTAEEASRS